MSTETEYWMDSSYRGRIPTEPVYTAYALTSRGREKIECYGTVQEAVQDMLDLWPEDNEGDLVIEDNVGDGVVYFARSDKNPRIVHIYFMETDMRSVMHMESYHCHYEPAQGGSVRTIIRKLG